MKRLESDRELMVVSTQRDKPLLLLCPETVFTKLFFSLRLAQSVQNFVHLSPYSQQKYISYGSRGACIMLIKASSITMFQLWIQVACFTWKIYKNQFRLGHSGKLPKWRDFCWNDCVLWWGEREAWGSSIGKSQESTTPPTTSFQQKFSSLSSVSLLVGSRTWLHHGYACTQVVISDLRQEPIQLCP